MALMGLEILDQRDRLVDAFEAGIRRDFQLVELKHVDYFSEGVYARELHIPAGTPLTGKIHKYRNFNILSKGEMLIFLDDGTTKHVAAPFSIVSPEGTRRAAFALTDCIWTTIHGTEETDVKKIEDHFIAQTPADYRLFLEEQARLEMNTTKEVA